MRTKVQEREERVRQRRGGSPGHTDVWFEGCEPNLGKTQEEHFPEGENPRENVRPTRLAVLRPVKWGGLCHSAKLPKTSVSRQLWWHPSQPRTKIEKEKRRKESDMITGKREI